MIEKILDLMVKNIEHKTIFIILTMLLGLLVSALSILILSGIIFVVFNLIV